MNLMEEIEVEIQKGSSPKWAILKDKAEIEILKMIRSGLSLEKQIELLLKHGIVEKLERKEYTGILKKHFGYQSAKRRTKKRTKKIGQENKNKKSIEERLSEDVNLMESFIQKKTAER